MGDASGISDDSLLPSEDGDSEADPLVGQVIAERYRVDARLGVGGMGAVYRAEHVLMKKPVAIKVLHREMTIMDEVVKRFEREAIAAGRIDHPNVTVATDFGKLADGSFYLVLEYVPGRSLTRALKDDGAFEPARALLIARQVAAALGAAHAAGIVHRDLKPDNIMLIERGGTRDFVKVLDFGIAKVAEAAGGGQLTRVGSVFGTPAYMSPEQAAGKTVDGRADLYSLGLVLYEMLAGRAAFESEELVALLTKQLTEMPPPLPEAVGADVAELVTRLLDKDPAGRHQSAEELIHAIDARLGPAAPPADSLLGVPSIRGVPSSARLGPVSARTAAVPPSSRHGAVLRDVRDRIADLAVRVGADRTLRISGRDVPRWQLGALALVVVTSVVLVLGPLRGKGGTPATAPSGHPAPPTPELGPVLLRAEEGDRAAVNQLDARPLKGRTAAEWRAIALGRGKLNEHGAALAAVAGAIEAEPALSDDRGLLQAVRRAADDEKAQKLALELASGPLGAGGADVLFDVWASTSEKTGTTALAKALLDREDVRSHASRPLRVALELRRPGRCEEAKRLVAEAKEVADERAFRPLKQLAVRKGCGFLDLSDCYPCLRQDDAVGDALKAAQSRKGPRF